jgi:cation diffusion facilitator family transporter
MLRDPRKLVMQISLSVSVLMLTGKLTAYFLTNSTAMFADAAESVVHGVATAFAAFSLWYASRPPDADHPYGHGRIVYFSTGFEGALVLAASIAVLYSGVRGFIDEPQLDRLGLGLTIAGGLAAINLLLGVALVRVGKKHHAVVVVANGKHVLSDFWTTAAAILGVTAVKLTGIVWLDPLAALLIGGWIMFSGIGLIRESIAGLMDTLDPRLLTEVEGHLRSAVDAGTITDFHELRCRRLNDAVFIDMHLLIPGGSSLHEAHRRASAVEESLRTMLPGEHVQIITHLEPSEHDSAHPAGHPHRLDQPESPVA